MRSNSKVSTIGSFHFTCLAIALLATFLVAAKQEKETNTTPDLTKQVWNGYRSDKRVKVTAHLKKLSDEELKIAFEKILKTRNFRTVSGYEPCLQEMIRRGGEQWKLFLKNELKELMAKEFKWNKLAMPDSGAQLNLELLTALRRVSKQPDPLQVSIEGPKELTADAYNLPILKVSIQNKDIEKMEAGFTFGGNYRSGRQSRWRIEIRDENGKAVPIREHFGFAGGGLYSEGPLKYGKSWETTLDPRSFVEVPSPGKYKLTVLYHNSHTIAEDSNVNGLIVFRSKPIRLTINPLSISFRERDRDLVRKLVKELDGQKKLKVIAGTYGEWAHELVSPDSPAGRLLGMGLNAVPPLVESLDDEDISKEKRAWLFSILFSLTSENDPRGSSAIGSYEFKESGWQIFGGRKGETPSGGFSLGVTGSGGGGEIQVKAQEKLIKAWQNWLKTVNVKNLDSH